MRISGFSLACNAVKLDYPLREALESILPLVDELFVTLSPGDPDDDTRGLLESIDDPRIQIIEAEWSRASGPRVYSDLSNLALERCTGDWCLYVQADEVVHEDDLPTIRARCEQLLGDRRVEGMLFDYLHFFGDYDHYQPGHGWYQSEIRLIRNGIGIRSARDAQSFRYPDERRLAVARSGARIFHYGWAHHPRFMQAKIREFWLQRKSPEEVEAEMGTTVEFDYGPLGRLPIFEGTHPAVMRERIAAMNWAETLRLVDPPGMTRTQLHKDERLRYRVLSALTRVTGVDLNHHNHGKVLRV